MELEHFPDSRVEELNMTNNEVPVFDLKSEFRVIANHATTDTKVRVQGGWLVCANLIIRSTADRNKLEAAGWRKRDSDENEWFRDFTASRENRDKPAREVYEGYQEVFNSFVDKSKKKLEERKVEAKRVAKRVTEKFAAGQVEEVEEVVQPASVGPTGGTEMVVNPVEAEWKWATAENKVDKEKDKMRTIEIPIAGMAKVFAVLVVVGAMVFGGFGLLAGKMNTDRQVIDVVHSETMSIMKVEEQSGEWLVYIGNSDKTERLFIRTSGDYGTSNWYDENGRRINDGSLEVLFQADKIRKQADEVLNTESEVSAD